MARAAKENKVVESDSFSHKPHVFSSAATVGVYWLLQHRYRVTEPTGAVRVGGVVWGVFGIGTGVRSCLVF